MAEPEKLTTWQVDSVLHSIARQTCQEEGVPWAHDGEWAYATQADYGDDLRAQWEDERHGVCICGCMMTRHVAIPGIVARRYCRACDALCRGGQYIGSAPPVK